MRIGGTERKPPDVASFATGSREGDRKSYSAGGDAPPANEWTTIVRSLINDKHLKMSEIRHVTIWELREIYGFKAKSNPHNFKTNFWHHHRIAGKSDLEIYKMWIKQNER